jgi:hypothetical protein
MFSNKMFHPAADIRVVVFEHATPTTQPTDPTSIPVTECAGPSDQPVNPSRAHPTRPHAPNTHACRTPAPEPQKQTHARPVRLAVGQLAVGHTVPGACCPATRRARPRLRRCPRSVRSYAVNGGGLELSIAGQLQPVLLEFDVRAPPA